MLKIVDWCHENQIGADDAVAEHINAIQEIDPAYADIRFAEEFRQTHLEEIAEVIEHSAGVSRDVAEKLAVVWLDRGFYADELTEDDFGELLAFSGCNLM